MESLKKSLLHTVRLWAVTDERGPIGVISLVVPLKQRPYVGFKDGRRRSLATKDGLR